MSVGGVTVKWWDPAIQAWVEKTYPSHAFQYREDMMEDPVSHCPICGGTFHDHWQDPESQRLMRLEQGQ